MAEQSDYEPRVVYHGGPSSSDTGLDVYNDLRAAADRAAAPELLARIADATPELRAMILTRAGRFIEMLRHTPETPIAEAADWLFQPRVFVEGGAPEVPINLIGTGRTNEVLQAVMVEVEKHDSAAT